MTDKVQNLSSSLSVMQELIAEKDKEIDRKDEMIRCKKTEVKVQTDYWRSAGFRDHRLTTWYLLTTLDLQCLSKIDDSSKDRIEELVRQVADLQQQLLDTQKEYLNKVKKDEVWREKQRAK